MATYITRVQLHDAKTESDYKKLHQSMEAKGFSRTITLSGIEYHLPEAEYRISGLPSSTAVLELAGQAVRVSGFPAKVLVVRSEGMAASGLEQVTTKTEVPKQQVRRLGLL